MTAKKELSSIAQQRRIALKIPPYKMYKDHGNHWCLLVAVTKKEAEAWKNKLDQAWSVHIEEFERKQVPGGHAWAVYIHG